MLSLVAQTICKPISKGEKFHANSTRNVKKSQHICYSKTCLFQITPRRKQLPPTNSARHFRLLLYSLLFYNQVLSQSTHLAFIYVLYFFTLPMQLCIFWIFIRHIKYLIVTAGVMYRLYQWGMVKSCLIIFMSTVCITITVQMQLVYRFYFLFQYFGGFVYICFVPRLALYVIRVPV